MTTKTIKFSFSPVFWLNLISAVLLILKWTEVINWAYGWVLLPWLVGFAMWLYGKALFLIGRQLAKRAHPAYKGGN